MAFDKEELRQLEKMFGHLRSEIALDLRAILNKELQPIKDRVDQLLQKRVRKLELKRA